MNWSIIPIEGEEKVPCGGVPHFDRPVQRAAKDDGAVGSKRTGQDFGSVPIEGALVLKSCRVVEFQTTMDKSK